MLKRTIKYTDFNDQEQEGIFYFNLSKSELVELEVSEKGGLGQFIQNVVQAEDYKELVAQFKRLILLAYGEKSTDGTRFIKSDELREQFSQTAAFDVLFVELATDDNAAADFVEGLVPKDMRIQIQNEVAAKSALAPPAPPNTAEVS